MIEQEPKRGKTRTGTASVMIVPVTPQQEQTEENFDATGVAKLWQDEVAYKGARVGVTVLTVSGGAWGWIVV